MSSFFSKLFKNLNPLSWIGDIVGGGLSILDNNIQANHNNNMMHEQMKYQTQEREASQAYQTSEREAQQSFQTSEREAQNRYAEQMYQQYQSPQALARQYQDAGLNPRLAMQNGSAGSVSASSGSSGGAPSSGAPSGASVNPPYFNLGNYSQGFQNIAGALKALGEAKRSGIDVKYLEDIYKGQVRKLNLEGTAQELANATTVKYGDKEHESALIKVFQDIARGDLDMKEIEKRIDILVEQHAISKYEKEHWLERFRADLANTNADTSNKEANTNLSNERSNTERTQQSLNRATTVLTQLLQVTEKTKPAVHEATATLLKYQGEAERISSEIKQATQLSEVKAIRERNKKSIELMAAQIEELHFQAELAKKNKDFALWDRINNTISALSGGAMAVALGRKAFGQAANVSSSSSYSPSTPPETYY